jgi:fluoride exporter
MRVALGVALLGALGSLCRWWLALAIQKQVGAAFPAGTLVVNVLGSVAIGAVMGFFIARGSESSGLRVALTAGFMGGFTTYSSFAFETLLLIERRSFAMAALNVGGTLVVCLGGCALGLVAGRAAGR